MNLRPSGYEPGSPILRKILRMRNLRNHNGLAVLFPDHHVDHGDHDDHNLATFWLQWHECASEKLAYELALAPMVGAVVLVGDEFAMPGQERIREEWLAELAQQLSGAGPTTTYGDECLGIRAMVGGGWTTVAMPPMFRA